MVEVRAQDFVTETAALPAELESALARDVGLTGEEYLAQSAAATVAVDVVASLESVIDLNDSELDGTELVLYVENPAGARVAEQVGATVIVGAPDRPDVSNQVLDSHHSRALRRLAHRGAPSHDVLCARGVRSIKWLAESWYTGLGQLQDRGCLRLWVTVGLFPRLGAQARGRHMGL
jgi:hypothetical protein